MRLIDADSLLKSISTMSDLKMNGVTIAVAVAKCVTIDAVPVVRCRDCKQGEVDDPDFPNQYYCHAGCGWNNGDFYCSYGERKEGADND